jgi:hypothetical protein
MRMPIRHAIEGCSLSFPSSTVDPASAHSSWPGPRPAERLGSPMTAGLKLTDVLKLHRAGTHSGSTRG